MCVCVYVYMYIHAYVDLKTKADFIAKKLINNKQLNRNGEKTHTMILKKLTNQPI